jgi:hypothetical protein
MTHSISKRPVHATVDSAERNSQSSRERQAASCGKQILMTDEAT